MVHAPPSVFEPAPVISTLACLVPHVEVHQGGRSRSCTKKRRAATCQLRFSSRTRWIFKRLGGLPRNAGTNGTMQMWHVGHDLERLASRARALGTRYFGPTAACGSVLARRGTLKGCALRKVPLAGARIEGGRAGATHVVACDPPRLQPQRLPREP